MNLFVLCSIDWAGSTFRPGQFITVSDRGIALAMIGAQRACAADESTAAALASPAASRGAVPYTPLGASSR